MVNETKFCSNCGAEIDKKAEICPKCGVGVSPLPPVTGDAPQGGLRILMYIISFCIPIIGIIIGLIYWVRPSEEAKAFGKTCVIVAMILPAFAIIGAFVFGMSGVEEPISTSELTSEGEPVVELESTPTPEPERVPTELNLKVGETAETSKIEVTVILAKKTGYYEYYSDIFEETMIEEASPGKIFILAEIEIKNTGSNRAYVGSSEFSMTDSEGYRYDPELYYGNDGLEMFKELYQNQKMRGKVLFEVPEDTKGLKIQYDFGNLFTKVKLASWELE